jgi:hypothetical protein
MGTNPMPIDALRRFTPTPLENSFQVDGDTVSVATNCQLLADRLPGAPASPARERLSPPAAVWRVVVEPEDDVEIEIESLISQRISRDGLALVTIGQKSFLAWDMQAHEGVSFISERFVSDEKLFQQYFLEALISLVKESTETPWGNDR